MDDTEPTAVQSPHSPTPLQSSGVIVMDDTEEALDRQLMVSIEAASLANEILEESIVNSEHSLIEDQDEIVDDKQSLLDEERSLDIMDSTRNKSPVLNVIAKCRSHPEILHSSVASTRDAVADTRSSSTTLIVDMTQLQINS